MAPSLTALAFVPLVQPLRGLLRAVLLTTPLPVAAGPLAPTAVVGTDVVGSVPPRAELVARVPVLVLDCRPVALTGVASSLPFGTSLLLVVPLLSGHGKASGAVGADTAFDGLALCSKGTLRVLLPGR